MKPIYKPKDAAEKTRQTRTGKGGKPGTDFQPDAARIQKNADWLDSFLAGQEEEA